MTGKGLGPAHAANSIASTAAPENRSLRRCERIARARARQAEPPAPPRQTLAFSRWRRRFRLRIDISSRLLTVAARCRRDGAFAVLMRHCQIFARPIFPRRAEAP